MTVTFPRRRAIQPGEQLTAVDQPGGCSIHHQGLPWYPRPAPDRQRHSPSVAGNPPTVNGTRITIIR